MEINGNRSNFRISICSTEIIRNRKCSEFKNNWCQLPSMVFSSTRKQNFSSAKKKQYFSLSKLICLLSVWSIFNYFCSKMFAATSNAFRTENFCLIISNFQYLFVCCFLFSSSLSPLNGARARSPFNHRQMHSTVSSNIVLV